MDKRTIFLDMDDVVADWLYLADKILGYPCPRDANTLLPNEDWAKIVAEERFYRCLPLKVGASSLVNWVRRYKLDNPGVRLAFLTAIPHGNDVPWAATDKVLWGQEMFPDIPVFIGPYSHDKFKYAKPGDILIDDRSSNITEWIGAGGLAHQYTTWEKCKPWLEQTLSVKY